ncbi:MAG TPA: class I SAM-dependent methyltransferase [Kiritimatiellia bacterium]|nr:class I SAM-dependent methyltransferase [Kiritimatiellia bacterium]
MKDLPDDAFAGVDGRSYDEDLARGLDWSGESRDFFARGRLAVVADHWRRHREEPPVRILDYGCAAGETTALLADRWPTAQVVGVDTSASLIAEARRRVVPDRCSFLSMNDVPADRSYDLIYCNGVFHHVVPGERAGVLEWIRSRLAPNGYFALWENNGWNPGVRWIMSRVAFDRDAVLLSPPGAIRMLRQAGFAVVSLEFHFVFPKWLGALRPIERFVRRFPFGAQYQVLARRAE